jgi:spore coat polysaccharide biosynthesis predicted glycosyltransferase SpsG
LTWKDVAHDYRSIERVIKVRGTRTRSDASESQQETLLFRCDGTSLTGLGHTSRCIALAEAFVDIGCRCSFFGHFDPPAQDLLVAAGMPWEPATEASWTMGEVDATASAARRCRASGIILDSYLLDADYVCALESAGAPVLLIDDFAALSRYDCSAVVNFTSRAEEYVYPRATVRCYLGLRWFLARRALRHMRARGPKPTSDVRRVLVAAGGNDPRDIIVPVVESLAACDSTLSVHVVAGASYRDHDTLASLLARFSGETRVLVRLPQLVGELEWADTCVSGAGLTKYEMAFVGMPAAVLSQNDGQARDTVRFEELGLVMDLGSAAQIERGVLADRIERLLRDASLRASLNRRGLETFPSDPTHDLATSVLANVFRARRRAQ